MTEGNKAISNDDELCRVFNNFFSKTVDELKIPNISNYKLDNTNAPLKEAVRYFSLRAFVTDLFNSFFTKGLTASVCKSDKMD